MDDIELAGSSSSSAAAGGDTSTAAATTTATAPTRKGAWAWLRAQVTTIMQKNSSPTLLALSIALGVVGGVFPIPGLTSVVCFVFALVVPVNMPAMQLVNILLTPVDIILVPMFVHFGETLLGWPHVSLSPSVLVAALGQDLRGAIGKYAFVFLAGIAGWIVWGVVAGFALFFVLQPILHRIIAGKTK